MNKTTLLLTVSFLLMLTSSCKYDADKMQQNKAIFASHRSEFEELARVIKQLRTERKLSASTFTSQEAGPVLKPKLETLDIVFVEIQSSQCADNAEIAISLSMDGSWLSPWYTPGTVQICYVPCDDQTKEGYEYYDGYHRNMYGLGHNWLLYSDTDAF
jgi:hypothetical protein